MRTMEKIKYKIASYLFGEDVGDLIYSIERGDYKDARKILRYLAGRKI